MILISHRGNLEGKKNERENTTEYVDEAISEGFDVEVDVWFIQENFYLGHDEPQEKISMEWILNRKELLWIHCKNKEVAEKLSQNEEDIHFFWHEKDLMTLTSKGFMWVYPGNQPIKKSIAVLPELFDEDIKNCVGICSDFIKKYI